MPLHGRVLLNTDLSHCTDIELKVPEAGNFGKEKERKSASYQCDLSYEKEE
jgi:hypothetical protein